ncbi:MAG: hypothetical protein Kow0074_17780 [Candidatus Zixiibacteriota bacterium]
MWHRIVYSSDFATIKSWGQSDPDPAKNLRLPTNLVANSGYWATGDNFIELFVLDNAPSRILRVWYNFFDNQIAYYGDSLSRTSDGLGFISQCDLHDAGTPGQTNDDTLWVLDEPSFAEETRLVLYSTATAVHGIKSIIEIPLGDQIGEVAYPVDFALGRDISGVNTNEVVILDGLGKAVQYRCIDGVLDYENEYVFSDGAGFVKPVSVAIDAYGQV